MYPHFHFEFRAKPDEGNEGGRSRAVFLLGAFGPGILN